MTLQLRYVAGVSPSKWLKVWAELRPDLPLEALVVPESEQLAAIAAGEADLAFVRLPIDDEGLHSVRLWEEIAVAVLPKDHPFADADALTVDDLADVPVAPVQPDPAMTVELVAAGTGYALLPHSVARLHRRKDVVAIPVTDASPTRIAIVWRKERDDADVQEFVAVVRGRGARSSRGDEAPTMKPAKAAKLAAAERRAAAGKSGKGGQGSGGKSAKAKPGRPAPRTGAGAKQRNRRRGR